MIVTLKDLCDLDIYVKFNSEFVKLLLRSVSNKSPIKDKELAEKLGIKFNKKYNKSSCIAGWYSNNRNIPINKLKIILEISKKYKWKDIEKNIIGIKVSGPGHAKFIKPNFPIKINKDLGLIVGHVLGDGWIDKKFSQPCYCNSNKELLKEFQESIYKIFCIKPRIWIQKNNSFEDKTEWLRRTENIEEITNSKNATLFYPKVIGQILYGIFGEFAKGRYKEVPELAFEVTNEFKMGLIRAFYDDESSISAKSHTIRVHQDNPDILEDIRKLLLSLCIVPGEIHYYLKRGKKRHYFNINGYYNFYKFQKLINFTSSKKRNELDKLINNLKNSKYFRLRVGITKLTILEMLEKKSLTYNEIRKNLKIKYPRIKWAEHTVWTHLKDLEKENKIIKIEKGRSYLWVLK